MRLDVVKKTHLGTKMWKRLDFQLLSFMTQPCKYKDIRTPGAHNHTDTLPACFIKSSWSCNWEHDTPLYTWENWGTRQWSDLLKFEPMNPLLLYPYFHPPESRSSVAFVKDHLLSPWLCYGVSREGPFVQGGARVPLKTQCPLRPGRWRQQKSEWEPVKQGETKVPVSPASLSPALPYTNLGSMGPFIQAGGISSITQITKWRGSKLIHPWPMQNPLKRIIFQEWYIDLPMPAPSNG